MIEMTVDYIDGKEWRSARLLEPEIINGQAVHSITDDLLGKEGDTAKWLWYLGLHVVGHDTHYGYGVTYYGQ